MLILGYSTQKVTPSQAEKGLGVNPRGEFPTPKSGPACGGRSARAPEGSSFGTSQAVGMQNAQMRSTEVRFQGRPGLGGIAATLRGAGGLRGWSCPGARDPEGGDRGRLKKGWERCPGKGRTLSGVPERTRHPEHRVRAVARPPASHFSPCSKAGIFRFHVGYPPHPSQPLPTHVVPSISSLLSGAPRSVNPCLSNSALRAS